MRFIVPPSSSEIFYHPRRWANRDRNVDLPLLSQHLADKIGCVSRRCLLLGLKTTSDFLSRQSSLEICYSYRRSRPSFHVWKITEIREQRWRQRRKFRVVFFHKWRTGSNPRESSIGDDDLYATACNFTMAMRIRLHGNQRYAAFVKHVFMGSSCNGPTRFSS